MFDAQANYYNPEPLSAGQAQQLGHPEWEGLKLDARDAERLVGGAARNQTTLQTHFGGQQRKLSAEDAAAISTPSLEGSSMSNDDYQRLLQGAQHNQQWDTNNQRTTGQSDTNNRRNNSTRITTTVTAATRHVGDWAINSRSWGYNRLAKGCWSAFCSGRRSG